MGLIPCQFFDLNALKVKTNDLVDDDLDHFLLKLPSSLSPTVPPTFEPVITNQLTISK